RLWFFSEDGKTTALKPGRVFEQVAENRLDEGFLASPAIAGKAFYLRTRTHLYRIEEKVGQALCLENSPRMNLDCGGMWDLRQVRSWCQGSERAQTPKVVSNSGLFGPFFVVGRAQFLIRLTGRQNL